MPLNSTLNEESGDVLVLMPTPPWNWNDLHKGMRRAALQLGQAGPPVELLLDLRQSGKLPAGAFGHIRSLGVALHPRMRNRLLVIGLEPTLKGMLGGRVGIYRDSKRVLRFVDDETEAAAVLALWRRDAGDAS
ncbi:MAG: hypothetical protein OXP68_01840 [Anaerolineaceae bacterium]|nr:hypothetical protein [Anaerolineaceae bacterium]MDE0328605.1 hypothetical protein [Anaerolineaceae bacterium]